MEPLLCYPEPFPPELALAIERAGYPWKAIARPEHAETDEPDDGWAGAVVARSPTPREPSTSAGWYALATCPLRPLLLVVGPTQLADLHLREDHFDDFCVLPVRGEEVAARLAHLFWRTGRGLRPELIEHGPLVLNMETYQAAVAGRASRSHVHGVRAASISCRRAPARCSPRETLLSRVWGYEYYGGAAHRGRPRAAPAAPSWGRTRPPHRDGALRRLPVRTGHLDAVSATLWAQAPAASLPYAHASISTSAPIGSAFTARTERAGR